MTDKQCLQRMRKMVRETHWVKSSLATVLNWLKNGESIGSCRTGPSGEYQIGKMGYCLMGMVGHVTKMPTDELGYFDISVEEVGLEKYPQAGRITEHLYNNLPQRFNRHNHESLGYKALAVETFNDSDSTDRETILRFLDKCIETHVPVKARKK